MQILESRLSCPTPRAVVKCRQSRKSKQVAKEQHELAEVATQGLAKLAMHASRWHSDAHSGMEQPQIMQVTHLVFLCSNY